ncbi:hypothetical protein JTB14_027993 [Gonioctena quinquepunctata]|nr:hypothetical protein JTB14_027993 [Gonioctena quinquepunctata]
MKTFLIKESSRYASFRNLPDPNIFKDEMKCFIAILIVSGYVVLPGKESYWESQGDMNNTLVSGAMRRDRFVQIMCVLHCADNSEPNLKDKVWELRPFTNKPKSKYVEHYQPEKHMSYDESMIKYYGRHPCKQFIRGKPNRFGYKIWALNTSGYSVDCELYQGKNSQRSEIYEREFGKAAAPFVTMLNRLRGTKDRPYELYFDSLFTGLNLFQHLKERGYLSTGTVREIVFPKIVPCRTKKISQKKKEEVHMNQLFKDR